MENPMIQVIIPVSLLLLIVLWKKMPYVGGNINAALLTAGALTLLLGGIWNPGEWVAAWVDGLNRLAWIICLSITGAIFAETRHHRHHHRHSDRQVRSSPESSGALHPVFPGPCGLPFR